MSALVYAIVYTVEMDVVSDAIAVMRTGTPESTRATAHQQWRIRVSPYDGAGFHVLLRGSCWLYPADGEPIPMGVGDVVLLPHGSGHDLADAFGRPDTEAIPLQWWEQRPEEFDVDGPVVSEVLCGKYRMDRSRAHPLLAELPDVVHIPASAGGHPELRAAVDLLGREVLQDRPGRDAALPGLLDLLLVYLLRAWLADRPSTGWSRALADPVVAAALQAMHDDPAHAWSVGNLGTRVGLSRAALARRFTALVGRPPMAYLAWWRMTSAARLLRESDRPLSTVAEQVGYRSAFAFSHAFKREFGTAPGQYRAQGGAPAAIS